MSTHQIQLPGDSEGEVRNDINKQNKIKLIWLLGPQGNLRFYKGPTNIVGFSIQ